MQILDNSTVYISFLRNMPRRFCLLRDNGELEYERLLDGKTPRIKFNVPIGGDFDTNTPVKVLKIVPIEIPTLNVTMPPYERARAKDFEVIQNDDLKNTPARIFTHEGIIEVSPSMRRYSKPMQKFFLLHEVGHFYYKTEKYCDLFALVHFLQMGYNMSTAMYCLTNVLRRNPENNERVMYIYNTLMKRKNAA